MAIGPGQRPGSTCRSARCDAELTWVVGGGQVHTRAAVVSTAPIGGLLETAAAVVLFILLTTVIPRVLVPGLRRRRRVSRHPAAVPHEVQIADAAVHHLGAR
jgi:hypothetical protein